MSQNDLSKVYENSEWDVYQIHSRPGALEISKDTVWCTAYPDSTIWYDYYMGSGRLFVLVNKATGNKYQIHPESGEFRDGLNQNFDYKATFSEDSDIWKWLTDNFDQTKFQNEHQFHMASFGNDSTFQNNKFFGIRKFVYGLSTNILKRLVLSHAMDHRKTIIQSYIENIDYFMRDIMEHYAQVKHQIVEDLKRDDMIVSRFLLEEVEAVGFEDGFKPKTLTALAPMPEVNESYTHDITAEILNHGYKSVQDFIKEDGENFLELLSELSQWDTESLWCNPAKNDVEDSPKNNSRISYAANLKEAEEKGVITLKVEIHLNGLSFALPDYGNETFIMKAAKDGKRRAEI